jgi:hypothetical protein
MLFNRLGVRGNPPPFYEFVEYPKWVTSPAGVSQLAHNANEEQAILNQAVEPVTELPKVKRGRPKK